MDDAVVEFFRQSPEALPIYERFASRVLAEVADVEVRVQKTQVSFYNPRMFACVSFLKVRRAAERPDPYLVVTLGLGEPINSPRIDGAVEIRPGRWTLHITLGSPDEVDDELMGWVERAAAFSARSHSSKSSRGGKGGKERQ